MSFKGKKHTPETRRKISEAQQGEKGNMWGKHLSLETRQKMSEAHKGKRHSPEARQRMSESHKGKRLSVEHKEKISLALQGKTRPLEVRRKISKGLRGRRASLQARQRMSISRQGEKNHQWRGGRRYEGGYVLVHAPDCSSSDCNGYIREHRLVMAEFLGRPLKTEEQVHHINGIRDDNRVENLMLFASGSEHRKFHGKNKLEDLNSG